MSEASSSGLDRSVGVEPLVLAALRHQEEPHGYVSHGLRFLWHGRDVILVYRPKAFVSGGGPTWELTDQMLRVDGPISNQADFEAAVDACVEAGVFDGLSLKFASAQLLAARG